MLPIALVRASNDDIRDDVLTDFLYDPLFEQWKEGADLDCPRGRGGAQGEDGLVKALNPAVGRELRANDVLPHGDHPSNSQLPPPTVGCDKGGESVTNGSRIAPRLSRAGTNITPPWPWPADRLFTKCGLLFVSAGRGGGYAWYALRRWPSATSREGGWLGHSPISVSFLHGACCLEGSHGERITGAVVVLSTGVTDLRHCAPPPLRGYGSGFPPVHREHHRRRPP